MQGVVPELAVVLTDPSSHKDQVCWTAEFTLDYARGKDCQTTAFQNGPCVKLELV